MLHRPAHAAKDVRGPMKRAASDSLNCAAPSRASPPCRTYFCCGGGPHCNPLATVVPPCFFIIWQLALPGQIPCHASTQNCPSQHIQRGCRHIEGEHLFVWHLVEQLDDTGSASGFQICLAGAAVSALSNKISQDVCKVNPQSPAPLPFFPQTPLPCAKVCGPINGSTTLWQRSVCPAAVHRCCARPSSPARAEPPHVLVVREFTDEGGWKGQGERQHISTLCLECVGGVHGQASACAAATASRLTRSRSRGAGGGCN